MCRFIDPKCICNIQSVNSHSLNCNIYRLLRTPNKIIDKNPLFNVWSYLFAVYRQKSKRTMIHLFLIICVCLFLLFVWRRDYPHPYHPYNRIDQKPNHESCEENRQKSQSWTDMDPNRSCVYRGAQCLEEYFY